MRDCLSIVYGRAEQHLSNHGVNMEIFIAYLLILAISIALPLWTIEKIKVARDKDNEYIELRVQNVYEYNRLKSWWANREVLQADLKRLTDEWFMEYAAFRDRVTERLDERETDIVNILAELSNMKKLEDIDDDIFHSLDMQIAELTRSQQLLLRTILERFPLPEKPTTPVRRKR